MQDIHPEGLKRLNLVSFGSLSHELDKVVLDQLIDQSQNLLKLTVSNGWYEDDNLYSLTYFLEKILNIPNIPLTHLNLTELCSWNETDFSVGFKTGKKMLNTLNSTT